MPPVPQHILNWLYSVLTSVSSPSSHALYRPDDFANLIVSCLQEYHDVNRTYGDVAQAISQYPSISPRTDVHSRAAPQDRRICCPGKRLTSTNRSIRQWNLGAPFAPFGHDTHHIQRDHVPLPHLRMGAARIPSRGSLGLCHTNGNHDGEAGATRRSTGAGLPSILSRMVYLLGCKSRVFYCSSLSSSYPSYPSYPSSCWSLGTLLTEPFL